MHQTYLEMHQTYPEKHQLLTEQLRSLRADRHPLC